MLLAVVGCIVYANALNNPFVFDDRDVIGNPHIRQLWPLSGALSAPPSTPGAGRPIINLSFALNYALGSAAPWGYHAGNLLLHVACALLFFAILRRTFGLPVLPSSIRGVADPLAFASAMLWLVHPLTSEIVNYISQRTEALMAFCYLLTLYCGIRAATADRSRAGTWTVLAIAACAVGMASKESMVTAPVVVLLFDAAFLAGGIGRALRARPWLHGGTTATWAILAALMVTAPRPESVLIGSAFSSDAASKGFLSEGDSPWTYLLNQAPIIVNYLKLSIWPRGLVFDYGFAHATTFAAVWWQFVAVTALALVVVVVWWRNPRVAFPGVWFFATLAPSSSIVPIAAEVGAERRMYLPLMAIVTVIVLSTWRLVQRRLTATGSERFGRGLAVALTLVAGGLAVLTFQRNAEYHTPARLWGTVVDRRPHGRAIYNLGESLKAEGRRSETVALYTARYEQYPEARYALAVELDADGKREDAIAHYREYIRVRPADINALEAENRLGRLLTSLQRLDDAEAAYRHVLSIKPQSVDAMTGLADVYRARDRYADALPLYRQALALLGTANGVPASALSDLYTNLGISLVSNQQLKEAVPEFSRAVELTPGDVAKQENLAHALADTGNPSQAIEHYRAALALAPQNAPLRSAFALSLLAIGQREQAIAEFQNALRLDPNNPAVQMDLAAAHDQLVASPVPRR